MFGLGTLSLWSVPCREFAPAGDLLLWASKEVGKKDAPTKPPLRGALRCSNDEARTQLAPLRSARTVVRSQFLKCASRTPRRSALLSGFEGGVPKQPQSPSARLRRSLGRVARATLHSSTGEPGVQPRVRRCTTAMSAGRDMSCARAQRLASSPVLAPVFPPARRTWCSCAVQGLFFGDFLLAPQKKVTRPPGRTPGTALATTPQHRVS